MFRRKKKPAEYDLAIAALERAARRLDQIADALESTKVRPINIYQPVPAATTAAEIARLQSMGGAQ